MNFFVRGTEETGMTKGGESRRERNTDGGGWKIVGDGDADRTK